jgi:hypothetical protein
VGIQDVLVLLPELRPQVGIAVGLRGKVPERVAALDDVGLDPGRRLGRVPRGPVVSHQMKVLGRTVGGHKGI